MVELPVGRLLPPAAPTVPTPGQPRGRGLLVLLVSALPLVLLSQGFFLEKALDLVLEMRLAALWGASARRDMYLLASSVLVPAAMLELVAIPLIVDIRRRGATGEQDVAASLATATVLFTALMIGLALAAWWLSGADAAPASEMLAATIAFGAAGVAMGLLSLAAGQHVADGRFAFVSARIPIMRAAMLACAFALPLGIAAPAMGAVVSSVLLAFVVLAGSTLTGWWRPHVRGLAMAAGLLALNAYPIIPRLLIERPLLGMVGDGTLATLDFAEKTTVILGLAGYAILGVATTALSGAMWSHRRRALAVLVLLIPIAALAGVFAHQIVSLLFERGAFSSSDSDAVTELTRLLAPSIPFVASVPLLVPGVRQAGALRSGVALIAAGLLVHTAATAYASHTGDARPLAIVFDAVYAALFASFYALAGPPAAEPPGALGRDPVSGGEPAAHG